MGKRKEKRRLAQYFRRKLGNDLPIDLTFKGDDMILKLINIEPLPFRELLMIGFDLYVFIRA